MRSAKRVLFLERNLRNEKLGVMYLSGSLKAAGHHADLVQADRESLDDRIGDYRPDFVAFSVTTGEHVHALATAREIKRRYAIPTIFGGPHCTFFPEIAREPGVDYVVQGQGERAIVDIIEGRLPPGFQKAAMAEHLDDLPFPDRDIFYQYPQFRDNPMKNVITSRACPYRCSYCFNHSQMALTKLDGETRRWFDRRNVENVVHEIQELRDRFPLEKLLYIDDSFIQSRAWLDEFLIAYTRDVRLPWLCSLRVNCLDDTLAQRMAESGLEMVNYAMESADPDVQERLLNRGHISNGDVISAIRTFDSLGIRARMQNMIGLPLSNPLEDALNTMQFNMRHRVTDSWCSIFQPYPRTALGQYCIDHGFANEEQLRNCCESFFDESRMDISDKKELYALQKLWYFVIEGNIPLDLVQILIRGEFNPQVGDALQRLRFRCSRRKLYGINDAEADTAVDLRSRERLRESGEARGAGACASGELLRAALRDNPLPDEFAEILSTVSFSPREMEHLRRHVGGEPVYPPPTYTVDDESGALVDVRRSIYIRGTKDPDAQDIRKMPEEHFMRQMASVRDTLGAAGPTSISKPKSTSRESLQLPGTNVSEDAPTATGEDQRHLNQFLA